MSALREQLANMFKKIMAGTVSREEGTMLINHLVREKPQETVAELAYLIDNPPQNVFPKTIFHTMALTRNKVFFNLMVKSLDHKYEDVSILAAEELAKLRGSESRNVLIEHLSSEVYHVRKASAIALAKGFGAEGVDVLRKHILATKEPFYRSTSAHGLLAGGKKGVDTVVDLLNTENSNAVHTAAETIEHAAQKLGDDVIPKIIEALMSAGDRKDTLGIVHLLKAAAAFKGRAKNYEQYLSVFSDYPQEQVRAASSKALMMIKSH